MTDTMTNEQIRADFEAHAEPMGFDLTRQYLAVPEPWAEYANEQTGYFWAGYQAATEKADQWRPIADAQEGVLVVCCWVDKDDGDMRHNFDYLEDGVWQNYFNEHEHYLIAGAASGRSEDAPYTLFIPLPPPPTGTKGNV